MGGEKFLTLLYHISLQGSPPRGRGKDAALLHDFICVRITPAWAGKRERFWSRSDRLEDHPRVGGEKSSVWSRTFHVLGSPPRGRGKVKTSQKGLQGQRITPAWAGKRVGQGRSCSPSWDHPRVGGEKMNRQSQSQSAVGSPPRGRGKDCVVKEDIESARITPAWAGKSQTPRGCRWRPKDHPRVGGEKRHSPMVSVLAVGSPPRGRGKAFSCALTPTTSGITPAWAGKRGSWSRSLLLR